MRSYEMCILHIFFPRCPVKINVHIAHVLTILDSLFAPLARLLVARGVVFPDFAERMRAHYIAAAERQAGKTTDSRLSVLTGLQRREVTRLRGFVPRDERPNPLSRLVALWQTDPAWAQGGTPLTLPRNGPARSFEALAWSVRRDVHPRTMLDALTASGTVALSEDGSEVLLVRASYQPLAGSEDQLAYLARNLGDHLGTATDNVLGGKPPQFERAVHYTGLTEAQVQALAEAHAEGQMALFQDLSRRAAAMKAAGPGGDRRFRAGAYFHQTEGDTP